MSARNDHCPSKGANDLYRGLVENLPLGIFRIGAGGTFTAINSAVAEMLGCTSAAQAQSLPAWAFLAEPSDWAAWVAHLETNPAGIEWRFRRLDGTTFQARTNARVVRDAAGRLLSVDGSLADATATGRGEKDLHRQALSMRAFQEIIIAVASRIDPLEILENLLKHTIAVIGTPHGFFFQYEAENDALVLKVGFGLYRPEIGFAIQKGDGLVGKVWQEQTPIIVNEYPSWPGRHPGPAWDAVHAIAGVPLQSQDSLLGVIGFLHTTKNRRIEDHEFELLNRFAELAVIALDKAQVYARLETELQERRQAEQALTASQARYRSVVEDLAEFVLRWKPDGRIIFANDAYCRYKHRPKTQVIGSFIKDLFSETAYGQAREIVARLNPGNPMELNDILTYGPDAQPIWEEWTDRGFFDEAGRLIEIQSVGRNITERKLAEKALLKSENRFRSFFNSNPEGIVLVDLDGNILDANKSLLQLAGYRLEEIHGTAYQRLIQTRYHARIARNIEAMLSGLVRDDILEVEYISKAGARIPVEARGWVITDEESQPLALGAFIRDITREKQLAADKDALQLQLQQTQKMEAIGTLAGGIAHDFNNILSGIMGYAELALIEVDDTRADLKHYLNGVLDACHRARSLVQQILRFSRRDDTDLAPLTMTPLLKEAVKLLRSTLPATIRIDEDIDAKLDTVVADATQLHQVVMNLGTNAYHAMRDTGGTLTISLRNRHLTESRYFMTLNIPPGEYVRLAVTDTGPGIPAELRDRIFEPYYTTKEKQEGTGLGLSVSFGIIQNLNGLITVEDMEAGSTTFAVYLPLARQRETAAPAPSDRLPRGRNENILCVDDESIFIEVVRKHLEGLEYRVTAFRSSVQALEHIKAQPAAFDLIITDQTMPEMTGVQLVAEIRKTNPDVPILLCTGYSEAVTAQTARQMGIASLLMKPVTRKELAKAVHRALQGQPS
jgi:PAS domain S-box-containing protein